MDGDSIDADGTGKVQGASAARAVNGDLRVGNVRLGQQREVSGLRAVEIEVADVVAVGQVDDVVRAVVGRERESVLQVLRRGDVKVHRPRGNGGQQREGEAEPRSSRREEALTKKLEIGNWKLK